jgi:hypothetical protein
LLYRNACTLCIGYVWVLLTIGRAFMLLDHVLTWLISC